MRQTDILYGPGSCAFHKDVLDEAAVEGNCCAGCGDELGQLDSDSLDAWSAAVSLVRGPARIFLNRGMMCIDLNYLTYHFSLLLI